MKTFFPQIKFPMGPLLEFSLMFDSKPEAKAFKNFLQTLENENSYTKNQNQNQIREKVKIKIPEMKSLEELKNSYAKAFLKAGRFTLTL